MKNLLIVGSGGREHAIAWKLTQSKKVGEIFVAPGNAGTSQTATNIPIEANNITGLLDFAKTNNIYLTIVGPDNTLALGIVDLFRSAGHKIFGPTKKAAEIEWSKKFAKNLMKKYGIPTADYYSAFSTFSTASQYVNKSKLPIVIKADGLALGKGVFICKTLDEANNALRTILKDKKFGNSGKSVIIEEYLEGKEVSAHAVCDGKSFLMFPLAQDHKRIGENNTGPNTGGMGTICPVPEEADQIYEIINKTLLALKKEGREFTGCLFPGLILTDDGPKVLEFNARFGDPETQSYMRLLKNDLLEVFEAVSEQRLNEFDLQWHSGAAACIVLSSGGYPDHYNIGHEITGLKSLGSNNKVKVFHAGTAVDDDKLVTAGGRVLNVTATGTSLDEALKSAYQAASEIHFKGKQFRKDIGFQYSKLR